MTAYIESETLELKAKFTDAICKEIVAFLNTSGGDIIIGVSDDGTVVGVDNIDETSKKISDIITDQIEPNPQSVISSEIRYVDGNVIPNFIKTLKTLETAWSQRFLRLWGVEMEKIKIAVFAEKLVKIWYESW